MARAREALKISMKSRSIPSSTIGAQLRMMRYGESMAHEAATASEKADILARIELVKEQVILKKKAPSDSRNFFPQQADTPAKGSKQPPIMVKKKTRPSQTPQELASDASEEIFESPSTLYTVKRDSATYKVVSHMLPAPSNDSIRGPIAWSDLVTGMVDLGLGIQGYCESAVTFRGDIMLPTSKEPQERSMVVHRPHPGIQLSPVQIRNVGKRISRW